MAGSASSQLRSAYVAEVTPGTIPATPAFTTLHSPALLAATAEFIDGRSLVSKGARLGNATNGIPVTGSLSGPMVYGVYDDFLATLLQGSWSTNVLKDGKATSTLAVENAIPAGAGGTVTMMRFRGVEAVGGSIRLASRQAATLNFELIGRGSEDATTSAIAGATYTDPTEADPLSSGVDVGSITFAGYTVDCIENLEINFSFENRNPQPRISSNDLCGITRGDFLPTLSARIYVEANFAAIYNAARARQATFAVTVPIGSVTGEKYTMVFHSCRFDGTAVDLSGADAFHVVPIIPQYSTSESCVVTITRAVT